MKRPLALIMVLLMVFALCGCGHEHTWDEATCTEPKTCSECGRTEGEALGHIWIEATCTEPKTCSVCGETEGEALGHTWIEATCTEPKTCSACGETEGVALGHTWKDATYSNPRKCSNCGETEGERLRHQWNVPVKSDAFQYGFYSKGDRYWVEISADNLSTSDLITMINTWDFNETMGIYDDLLLEWVKKAANWATSEWYSGTVLHAKSSGYGDWECWIDTSDTHAVIGLANNKAKEIETFCVGSILE